MFHRLLLASAAAFACSAQANVLDFGNGPDVPTICSATADGSGANVACNGYGYLNQSYGDIAGVVDVVYGQPRIDGNPSLHWWPDSYSNLYGVAWADSGDTNSKGVIDILPLAGGRVVLDSFDLGVSDSAPLPTHLQVIDLATNSVLYSFDGNVGAFPANLATNFSFGAGLASTGGLRIQWADSAYDVGIDNIAYRLAGQRDVVAIPEPQTWMLMLAGLVATGVLLRRRGAR